MEPLETEPRCNAQLEAHYRANYDALVIQYGSEDVVQEGYTRAIELHDYFDWDSPDPEDFNRWLHTILSKCKQEQWRFDQGRGPIENIGDDEQRSPEEHMAALQAVEVMESKPLHERWVLQKYFMEDVSINTIVKMGPVGKKLIRKYVRNFAKEISRG